MTVVEKRQQVLSAARVLGIDDFVTIQFQQRVD